MFTLALIEICIGFMYFFFLIFEVEINIFIAEKRCWIFLLHRYNTAARQAYSESQPVPSFVQRNAMFRAA